MLSLVYPMQKEKKASKESLDCMENRLLTYVGITMRKLAISFEKLKEIRYACFQTISVKDNF